MSVSSISGMSSLLSSMSQYSVNSSSTKKSSELANSMAQMLIKENDTDGDGKLTASEVSAFSTSMLTEIDSDEDGFLTLEELSNSAQSRLESKGSLGGPGGPGGPPPGGGPDEAVESSFNSADTNGDGILSYDELVAAGMSTDDIAELGVTDTTNEDGTATGLSLEDVKEAAKSNMDAAMEAGVRPDETGSAESSLMTALMGKAEEGQAPPPPPPPDESSSSANSSQAISAYQQSIEQMWASLFSDDSSSSSLSGFSYSGSQLSLTA